MTTTKRVITGSVNCCGATISHAKTYNRKASKGVHIIAGIVGKEVDNEKTQIKHIKTKNGDFTVACKLDW